MSRIGIIIAVLAFVASAVIGYSPFGSKGMIHSPNQPELPGSFKAEL